MSDLLRLLERIAIGVERLADGQAKEWAWRDEQMAAQQERQRKLRAFWHSLRNDGRFPGLESRIRAIEDGLGSEVVGALLDRRDPIALVNYLASNKSVLSRLDTLEPPMIAEEMARIEQRLQIGAIKADA